MNVHDARDRWLEAMRRAALHYPEELPPRPSRLVTHERILSHVYEALTAICVVVALVSLADPSRSVWWAFAWVALGWAAYEAAAELGE